MSATVANIDEALTNGQIGRQSRSVPFWNTACPDSFGDARKGPFDSPDGSLKVSQARGSATHRVQSRGFGDRRRSRFFYIPHPTPPFPLPIGVYSDISLAPAMSSSNDSSESASQENERRRAERKPAVRWRSRIGVATALFLVGGAINFASAVSTPILLHFLGPALAGPAFVGPGGPRALCLEERATYFARLKDALHDVLVGMRRQ